MYVPQAFVMGEPEMQDFLEARASGHLVTVGADGLPDATLLPIIVDGDRVLGHLGRKNPQWGRIAPGSPGLVVVSGADAYVSPSWYAAKAEHGRVVPTWNYTEVHLRGAVTVHDDPDWVLDVVTRLTERHESHRDQRWHLSDAPEKYLRGQLLGIVGIEVVVESVEGKAKLGQNRSDADRFGAVEGLRAEPGVSSHVVADDMEAALER
ncbi:FMN-binding negative transcriptional regulator [Terrabacter sp. 2RAF25]|uniref:FMN-binding negative transcriptional regulator n=1 Tax=Terrabacter sp. 2RAF25 TaxID=3232998 RepID=UPI003F987044